ncbi:MAG: hypothetical protein IT438_10555 [Phycisphaerales bacterium]|nr:hypothetical protein [Phycisphaerales bacterium]
MTAIGAAKLLRTTAAKHGALVVRWEISPSAIRCSPLPEVAAMNGQAERIGRATLEWRVEDDIASAALRLEIGEDDAIVPLVAEARASVVRDGEWVHIEVDDRLTASERDGRVVYAQTTLLAAALGLSGGVYEAPAGGIGILADDSA